MLKAHDVPSILVETAFISNPEEEKRLNDKAYQDKLARAILGGHQATTSRKQPAAPDLTPGAELRRLLQPGDHAPATPRAATIARMTTVRFDFTCGMLPNQ